MGYLFNIAFLTELASLHGKTPLSGIRRSSRRRCAVSVDSVCCWEIARFLVVLMFGAINNPRSLQNEESKTWIEAKLTSIRVQSTWSKSYIRNKVYEPELNNLSEIRHHNRRKMGLQRHRRRVGGIRRDIEYSTQFFQQAMHANRPFNQGG